MANRTTIDKQYTLIKGQNTLYCAVNVGAAGAVTLMKWNYPQLGSGSTAPGRTYTAAPTAVSPAGGMTTATTGAEGVLSVTRTGAGLWTVKLQDNWQRCLDLHGYTARAGGTVTVADFAEDTTVSNYAATGGSVIGVVMFNSSDVAGDGASGDQIRLTFVLQNLTTP